MFAPGQDGEDERAEEVENQIEPRVRVQRAELRGGKGNQDQQGADDLHELVHGPSVLRPKFDSEHGRDGLEYAGPDVDLNRGCHHQGGDRKRDGEEGGG